MRGSGARAAISILSPHHSYISSRTAPDGQQAPQMSSLDTQDCAVCDSKTSQRCSGCSVVPFCSHACQSLIWKTHKQFCTRPAPTAFTLPPLTKDEAAYFTKPVSPANGPFVLNLAKRTRMYWDEYMAKREWFPGMEYTGDELMAELVKKEGCAIPEPGRTFIIAGLFQHIYFANAAPHLPCPPRSQWHMSGHDLLWFTQLAEEEGLTLPADILERVNPFFQQILIYHTLSLDERPYSQGRVIHTLRLTATKRLLPHLQKSNLALSEALGQCLWKVAQNCLNGAVEMPMVGAMAGLLGEEAVFGSKLHRGGY